MHTSRNSLNMDTSSSCENVSMKEGLRSQLSQPRMLSNRAEFKRIKAE